MTRRVLGAVLLGVAMAAQASTVVVVKKPVSANCTTGKSITFWWRAENSTTMSGTLDFTAGDNVASPIGTTPVFSASAAKNGSYGISTPQAGTYYQFDSPSIVNGTTDQACFWWQYPTTYPTSSRHILHIRQSSTVNIRINTGTGTPFLTLEYVNGTTSSVSGSGSSLSAATWYFVCAKWDASQSAGSDVLTLAVYNSDGSFRSTASATSSTQTMTPITPATIRWGASGGAAGDSYADHLIFSSSLAADLTTCMNQGNYDGS